MILCSITNDLIPICICCVLPITIVWIVMKTARFREAKRTEVLIKAIESGKDIDANMIANAMAKPAKFPKSPHVILNIRLTIGCVFTLIAVLIGTCIILGYCMGAPDVDFLMGALMLDSIPLGVGIAFLIVYFVTRKQVKD